MTMSMISDTLICKAYAVNYVVPIFWGWVGWDKLKRPTGLKPMRTE